MEARDRIMDGTRSALIVASDAYTDAGLKRLRAPAADARALAAVLRDPEIGGFEVRTLLNEPVHMVNLAVEEFFADRRPDDLLLVHFSCHGVKDEAGELYFAASNTQLGRLGSTAVAADFVNRRMNRSRSRRVVLLLDCCYAGAFERGMTARAGAGMAIEEQFGGRGRAVITASSAMEYAFEGDDLADTGEPAPSVFTSALVEGLRTGDADRDQDGLVGLDELYDYVYDKVREATPNQTPGKWSFAVQGDLYIARRAQPVDTPAPLPPELQDAIDHPLAAVRAGAAQELARLLQSQHAGLALAARMALAGLANDDSRAVAGLAAEALGAQPAPARPGPLPARADPGPAPGPEEARWPAPDDSVPAAIPTGEADLRTGEADPRAGEADPRAGEADPRTTGADPRAGEADPQTTGADLRTGAADPRTGEAITPVPPELTDPGRPGAGNGEGTRPPRRGLRRRTAISILAGIGVLAVAGIIAAVVLTGAGGPGAASIRIAASSNFSPVAGHVFVTYRGARDATARISAEITGAARGEVARLYAQRFPYSTAPAPVASAVLRPTGTTASHAFRVRPGLATRYKIELFRSGTATTPLATSAASTVYVTATETSGHARTCSRPVCREKFRVRVRVPAETASTEISKRWYPYFGLNLASGDAPAPPKSLLLGAGHPRITSSRRISASEFSRTVTFSFRIGNHAYAWSWHVCSIDTEAQDGIGLPGHGACGRNRAPAALATLAASSCQRPGRCAGAAQSPTPTPSQTPTSSHSLSPTPTTPVPTTPVPTTPIPTTPIPTTPISTPPPSSPPPIGLGTAPAAA